jgi:hypothetical protein
VRDEDSYPHSSITDVKMPRSRSIMHFLSSFWDIHNVYLKRSMLPEQNESVGTLILCHRWSKFCGGSDRGLFPGSNRYEGKSDN